MMGPHVVLHSITHSVSLKACFDEMISDFSTKRVAILDDGGLQALARV